MKKICLVQFILAMIFLSCGNRSENNSTGEQLTDSTSDSTNTQLRSASSPFRIYKEIDCNRLRSEANNRYHPIDEQCMLHLVENFLKLNKSNSFSGYIKFDGLAITEQFVGMKFYFCYANDKLFICYKNSYDTADVNSLDCNLEEGQSLLMASELKTYSRTISANEILSELGTIKSNFTSNTSIPYATVNTYQTNFEVQFGGDYESSCLFFKKDEIDSLKAQPGLSVKGLWYLLGYDDSLKNKIRVILVAVDQTGRLYLRQPDGNEAVFLEHAFPPN